MRTDDRGIQYWQQFGQWEQEQETGAAGSASQGAKIKEIVMHIGKFSQSKYIKQSDVEEPTLVTVRGVTAENVAKPGEEERIRAIVHFEEFDKGMVFNKTNLNRAAKSFGSEDTDDWIGKKLVIYVDEEVEMAGEIVGGLRVRAPKVVQQKTPARASHRPNPLDDMESDIQF